MSRQLLGADASDLTQQGYEDVVQCPYEKAHQIMAFRMQTHLYKCRKNHKDLKYTKCPFNQLHDIPEQELKIHMVNCPDRETFDRYKYCISTSSAAFAPEVESNAVPSVQLTYGLNDEDNETWDSGYKVRAYNPRAYAARTNVIRKATGMTPSEKRAFREAERQRFHEGGRRYKVQPSE
ncbi:gametocyte-specific factor 1 homolog [Toxorhynchites rutilus septentrionalis]|uniref:gametocyte-specific factor 1 homolog n=1 Tax=Toxorhynchites rutilus septentrionalis TaxID=329112 RepID=UPI00247AF9A5|nr:gametocyte-specific factor 1 homolog [Toxorhynchites rutilus septentrionalis]